MNTNLQELIFNTDFVGYAIIGDSGFFQKTHCPNSAVGIALDRSRECPDDRVTVFSVATMGKYHHNPGERVYYQFNWKSALKELMD